MGVVAVGRAGGAPLLASYGLANVELVVPHRPDGIFMIGSVSKHVTAVAILLLEEAGKLSTEDTIEAYFPELQDSDRITIEQLLTHSSGVADIYSLPRFGITAGRAGSFEDAIADVVAAPLDFEPGTRFQYSNGGYTLLAAIVEQASGLEYGQFLAASIFDPLGMEDSAHDSPGPVVPRRVAGYLPWGVDGLTPAMPIAGGWTAGAGSIWSSGEDLLAWASALHGGRILSEASYAKLVEDRGDGYGFGISIFERFGRAVLGHDGRVSGYASDLAHYPATGATIAVLSNVESVARDEIRRAVAAEIFGEAAPGMVQREFLKARAVDLDELLGSYEFFPGFQVHVTAAGGRLLARANEGADSELVPLVGGAWFSRMLYTTVQFERDASGRVSRLQWGEGEGAPAGRRVD
jgi:CubicO group peptidase (beta-lactamase class C family)